MMTTQDAPTMHPSPQAQPCTANNSAWIFVFKPNMRFVYKYSRRIFGLNPLTWVVRLGCKTPRLAPGRRPWPCVWGHTAPRMVTGRPGWDHPWPLSGSMTHRSCPPSSLPTHMYLVSTSRLEHHCHNSYGHPRMSSIIRHLRKSCPARPTVTRNHKLHGDIPHHHAANLDVEHYNTMIWGDIPKDR